MTPEASRRGFLGALALATPAFGLGLQRPSSGTPAPTETDAVFDQIHLQFVVALRRARSTGSVSAEDAAACATSLRIAAVHARDRGLDQVAATALRRTIAREGRDALVARQPDLRALVPVLARRGIDVPARVLDLPLRADAATREAVLEGILAGKTSAAFDRLAAAADRAVPELARRQQGRTTVQFSSICELLLTDWMYLWAMSSYLETLLEESPELWGLFENYWAALLMIDGMYWTYCAY